MEEASFHKYSLLLWWNILNVLKILAIFTLVYLNSIMLIFWYANIFNHKIPFLSDTSSVFNLLFTLGKDANPEERKAAMKTAEQFLQQMNYSANTQVRGKTNWPERKWKARQWWHSCKIREGEMHVWGSAPLQCVQSCVVSLVLREGYNFAESWDQTLLGVHHEKKPAHFLHTFNSR